MNPTFTIHPVLFKKSLPNFLPLYTAVVKTILQNPHPYKTGESMDNIYPLYYVMDLFIWLIRKIKKYEYPSKCPHRNSRR